jgi:hypothetical protein
MRTEGKGVERDEPWQRYNWLEHTQLMLDSFRHWLGHDLIPRSGSFAEEAAALFCAPFVVVSHGTQDDPILNYGNQAALDLWEMEVETLLQTPSRMTAEPLHRDERAMLLERTTRNGFVDDYEGIRISSSGRRFRIERAIVWNLLDREGNHGGQAATFSQWHELPGTS